MAMKTALRLISSPRVSSFRSVPRSRFMSEAVAGMTHYANTLTIQWAGEPSESLVETQVPLSEPQENEIQIQMLAAPINPSDINTVQGTYPLKPGLPGVGGHEGVGRVNTVGPSCKNFKVGDLVVPLASAQGTWRDRGNFQEEHWHKVPSDLPLVDAATLTINPGTALCMLEHFVDLKDGDCVIQSGANSAVGQYVIQICKLKGVKTINIVRDRPDRKWDDVVSALKEKGADLVATPDSVREEAKKSGLPKPKLALNCVGGEVATTMAKMLDQSGTIVTYGGMARQPVSIPIPLLIFNDIRCLGFWISGHMSQLMGLEGKAQMYDRLAKMVLDGQISAPPAKLVSFSEWKEAFKAAQGDNKNEKIILRMRDDQDNSEVNATPAKPEARRW